MTPRQFADKYPAQWQVYEDYITLHIGHCTIKVYPDHPESDWLELASVQIESPMSRDQDMDDMPGFESLPESIGYLLAREIVRDEGAFVVEKIPDWAKDATRLALEPHRRRIEETQTHLEWSKK